MHINSMISDKHNEILLKIKDQACNFVIMAECLLRKLYPPIPLYTTLS